MYYEKNDRRLPPVIDPANITKHFSADVVIIGGGYAGTQCALSAVENGLSVIVLESQKEDKLHWFGEQIAAYNSAFQISRGFGPYDTDEIVDELYRSSSYLANPVLIAKYVENSGEMIDHMLGLLPDDSTLLDEDQFNIHQAWGNPKSPIRCGGHKTWAATMTFRGPVVEEYGGPDFKYKDRNSDYQINERSRLPELQIIAMKRAQALGAQWYFGTRAVALNDSGHHIAGVIASIGNNEYAEYSADTAVVLSTGDFSSTGVDLGLSAGGFTEPILNLKMQMDHIHTGFGSAAFLTLNRDGKRFMDESIAYAMSFALDRQPDGPVCIVTDSNFFEQIKRSGLFHGNADFGRPEYIRQSLEDFSKVPSAGRDGYLVRDMNTSEREKHRFFAAPTLELLADYLGYSDTAKKNFLDSVARYNEMCYAGKDRDFRKDPNTLIPIDKPPYYGLVEILERKNRTGSMTPVGLVTNDDFNVLQTNGDPVSGLYAIGNCLGRRFGTYYATPSGGQYIGYAMTHGRVLGKQLAEEKKSRQSG